MSERTVIVLAILVSIAGGLGVAGAKLEAPFLGGLGIVLVVGLIAGAGIALSESASRQKESP